MPKQSSRKIDLDEVISDTLSTSEFKRMEQPLTSQVFTWMLIATLSVGTISFVRTAFLSLMKGESYALRSQDNLNQNIPLIASRGIIVDRYGDPMVENQPVFSLFLHIDQMVKHDEKDAVLQAVEDILHIEEQKVIDFIKSTNLEDVSDIIIANGLSREEVIAIESLNLVSLNIEESFKRNYTNPAYSHLVGYVGLVDPNDLRANDSLVLNDSIGRSGLEQQYDDLLRGENGRVTVLRDSLGKINEILRTREPNAGQLLETTVDAKLQEYFYSRMLQGLLSLGRTSGLGIALDPRNGEILSLISFPSFDANDVSSYLDSPSRPLFNRAISGVYNPGSTIKPLHATAALNEGIISPDKGIFSAGYIEIPNPYNPDLSSRFVDWKAHGWVDVRSAIARSSNVYFYVIGGGFQDQEGLGINRLNKYWREFGLDKTTGVDIPGESIGFLPDPEEKEQRTGDIWRIGDTYNVSIGQGDLSLTPLRLISSIAAIANGKAYTPHVYRNTQTKEVIDITDMSSSLKQVQQGMIDGTNRDYGTANLLSNIPMVIGSKTGSAQVAGKTKTNALYVGYGARDENSAPEIVIMVLIEDAREGSLNAVPIARDIFQWYYDNRIDNAENSEILSE